MHQMPPETCLHSAHWLKCWDVGRSATEQPGLLPPSVSVTHTRVAFAPQRGRVREGEIGFKSGQSGYRMKYPYFEG